MKYLLKILVLTLIFGISLFFLFWRQQVKKINDENGTIELSSYGITVFGNYGNIVFSMSPLNDYYYNFSHKEHIYSKQTFYRKNNLFDNASVDIKGLFLNREELVWKGEGFNSVGLGKVGYEIKFSGKKIEIKRNINIESSKITNVGEALKICQGCLIADDKGRVFFNGELINENKIKIASDLNRTLFALGANQSFPQDISIIYMLNTDGEALIEIPITNQEIFFDEEWGILEFKTNFNLSENTMESFQNIYLIK